MSGFWLYFERRASGFADGMGERHEGKREVGEDPKDFGLSNWRKGIARFQGGEGCGRIRFGAEMFLNDLILFQEELLNRKMGVGSRLEEV